MVTRKAAERLGFIIRCARSAPAHRRLPRRAVLRFGTDRGASDCRPTRGPSARYALALVHISGCAKGCAHPGPAPLTIVGTSQGCGIVRDGTARETPETYVAVDDLAATVNRFTKTREAALA